MQETSVPDNSYCEERRNYSEHHRKSSGPGGDDCKDSIATKCQGRVDAYTSKLLNFCASPQEVKIFFQHKLSAHTKKLKAALVLSKIKNDEIKSGQTAVEDFKTSNLDLKRQLLNEVQANFNYLVFLFKNLVSEKREKQIT